MVLRVINKKQKKVRSFSSCPARSPHINQDFCYVFNRTFRITLHSLKSLGIMAQNPPSFTELRNLFMLIPFIPIYNVFFQFQRMFFKMLFAFLIALLAPSSIFFFATTVRCLKNMFKKVIVKQKQIKISVKNESIDFIKI